jgi:hypothetical protein
MKKIVIPTILAATILVAGMFAMMPVQKAATVHSAIGSSIATLELSDADNTTGDVYTVDCTTDFVVSGAYINVAGAVGGGGDEVITVAAGELARTFTNPPLGGSELLGGDLAVLAAEDVDITFTDTTNSVTTVDVQVAVRTNGAGACTLTETV